MWNLRIKWWRVNKSLKKEIDKRKFLYFLFKVWIKIQ